MINRQYQSQTKRRKSLIESLRGAMRGDLQTEEELVRTREHERLSEPSHKKIILLEKKKTSQMRPGNRQATSVYFVLIWHGTQETMEIQRR